MNIKKHSKAIFFSINIILLLITQTTLFAQFKVTISSNYKSDTIKTCIDSTIQFYAQTSLDGNEILDVTYNWEFDDGTTEQGINADTVEYKFPKHQGYLVKVTASKDEKSDYAILPIEIALTPNFYGTKSNVPESQDGICNGEEVELTGKASDSTWKYVLPEIYIETSPQIIENNKNYSAKINHKFFPESQTINSATDIDTISVNIEHSNINELKISLECPNGQQIVLKDFGGGTYYFGEPDIEPSSSDHGTGFNYYWTNSPDNNTINSTTLTETTIPSGSYLSNESFNGLVGCPLNGDWQIKISDNKSNNNGYIFNWSLRLNKDIEPKKWEYTNTYSLKNSIWSGQGVTATGLGVTTAIPKGEGNTGYTFSVKDNYQCWHDTIITVRVESASFSYTPESEIKIGDEVSFENTTSWANNVEWDFGDLSEINFLDPATHVYSEKGEFLVTFKAISESGCSDIDTSRLTVEPIPVELSNANIFTPNNDNINDVYRIFDEENSYLPNGSLTGMAANVEEIKAKIFNRYGETMIKWNTIHEVLEGWDGTRKNKGNAKCAPGTYFIDIYIKGKDGTEYKISKTIYLYLN